ncbi:MFS transporter, partial [Salmonella enterica subsp. enterica serovar Typhi]|nr:MFS transporter [Salmonella enterica subsp. enterica serovar Typhi]
KLIIIGAFYIAVMTILASYATNVLFVLTICFLLALGKLIIIGAFYIAVMTILASYATNVLFVLTICFLLALGLPMINIAIGGWMPTIIEPKMMGRVQGWITPLMMLSQSITLGIISIGYPKWF